LKVIRFGKADNYEPETDWKRTGLCAENGVSIEHFTKPAYHSSPWHEHENAQVLFVIQGQIAVQVEGGLEQILDEGDTAYFDSGERHIVTNVLDTPAIGLDIFVPGHSFDFWLKRKKETQ